jgi:hypothetical protein
VPPRPTRFADGAGALARTGESIVRYVAPIFQMIVFYAAGAALFFAVSHVR